MKRNRVTGRTDWKEGLEIFDEIESGDERDNTDIDLIQKGELLTLKPLQLPLQLIAK